MVSRASSILWALLLILQHATAQDYCGASTCLPGDSVTAALIDCTKIICPPCRSLSQVMPGKVACYELAANGKCNTWIVKQCPLELASGSSTTTAAPTSAASTTPASTPAPTPTSSQNQGSPTPKANASDSASTPSPTLRGGTSQSTDSSSSGGLSTLTVVIIAAAGLLAIIAAVLAFLVVKKRRPARKQRATDEVSDISEPTDFQQLHAQGHTPEAVMATDSRGVSFSTDATPTATTAMAKQQSVGVSTQAFAVTEGGKENLFTLEDRITQLRQARQTTNPYKPTLERSHERSRESVEIDLDEEERSHSMANSTVDI